MASTENGDDAAEGIGGEAFKLSRRCGLRESEGFFLLRGETVDRELAKVAGKGVPFFGEEGNDTRVL